MQIIVTGGAGFIGVNTALDFGRHGYDVLVIDNLSRLGSAANLAWLREQFTGLGRQLEFAQVDVRDFTALAPLFTRRPAEAVIHLAGQVAVTTSVQQPREDFEVNALGTFNLLEAVRLSGFKPLVLYASTNKVYGGMEDVAVELQPGPTPDERDGRYGYRDLPQGIRETNQLDFHSPYGCSKGAADQYVRDYARIYGFPTAVFRQSCIYGPRQFGIEDQGWVAWFIIAAVTGSPLCIYGDGKQVRDLLHVDDLTRAYRMAVEQREQMLGGRIFNIGGGPHFALSLLGLLNMLERVRGTRTPFSFGDWRPGDQPVYISDIDQAAKQLGWRPAIDPETGIRSLVTWVEENKEMIRAQLGPRLA